MSGFWLLASFSCKFLLKAPVLAHFWVCASGPDPEFWALARYVIYMYRPLEMIGHLHCFAGTCSMNRTISRCCSDRWIRNSGKNTLSMYFLSVFSCPTSENDTKHTRIHNQTKTLPGNAMLETEMNDPDLGRCSGTSPRSLTIYDICNVLARASFSYKS